LEETSPAVATTTNKEENCYKKLNIKEEIKYSQPRPNVDHELLMCFVSLNLMKAYLKTKCLQVALYT